jgi:polyhydroxybutyrate depolymerase
VSHGRVVAGVALLCVLGGCSANGSAAPDPTLSGGTTRPGTSARIETRSLRIDDLVRAYGIALPPNTNGAPLLIMLHLGYGKGSPAEGPSSFVTLGPEHGVVVAAPAGIGISWNAGNCCGDAVSRKVDDVAFIRALVSDIRARDHIDAKRVFVVGFSNGGFMAQRVACELAGFVRGVASVEGRLGIETCRPVRPLDVFLLNQTGDEVVPLAGVEHPDVPGGRGPWQSAAMNRTDWVRREGCRGTPRTTRRGAVSVTTYACAAGTRVRDIVMAGGDHSWPLPESALDANRAILSFFGLENGAGA